MRFRFVFYKYDGDLYKVRLECSSGQGWLSVGILKFTPAEWEQFKGKISGTEIEAEG